jgi:hypothetical protein
LLKSKKAIGRFVWAGMLYMIDRRQLNLKLIKGGMGLINVELKMKALILRNNLYRRDDSVLVSHHDFFYSERNNLQTSRNTKEWFEIAANIVTRNLVTTTLRIFSV